MMHGGTNVGRLVAVVAAAQRGGGRGTMILTPNFDLTLKLT